MRVPDLGVNAGLLGSNNLQFLLSEEMKSLLFCLVSVWHLLSHSVTSFHHFLQPQHYSRKLHRIESLVEEEIIVPFHPPVVWQFYRIVKMADFNARINVANTLGCSRQPSYVVEKYLGRICEDCFNIYRNYYVYEGCR